MLCCMYIYLAGVIDMNTYGSLQIITRVLTLVIVMITTACPYALILRASGLTIDYEMKNHRLSIGLRLLQLGYIMSIFVVSSIEQFPGLAVMIFR
jgi:hypothetical protein